MQSKHQGGNKTDANITRQTFQILKVENGHHSVQDDVDQMVSQRI